MLYFLYFLFHRESAGIYICISGMFSWNLGILRLIFVVSDFPRFRNIRMDEVSYFPGLRLIYILMRSPYRMVTMRFSCFEA